VGSRDYQILDLGLTLETPDEGLLRDFHLDYARFESHAPLEGENRLRVRFEPGGPHGPAFLETGGERRYLGDYASPSAFALFQLHRIIMDAVQDFTVLHGAVLAKDGRALVISGPSGTGKTTLTLDLLDQGLAFLSDDFCPVSRATGLVHPFPRSLWVRDEAGAGTVAPLPDAEALHRGKRALGAGTGAFRIHDQPCPLGWLVLLEGEAQGQDVLRVRLREAGRRAFLDAAAGLGGVETTHPGGAIPDLWEFRYARGGGLAGALADLLEAHRDTVILASNPPRPGPDFNREPRLEPIPSHEAAFILLRERKQHRLTLGEGKVKAGAFLMHLNEILAGASCFRLTPGYRRDRLERVLAAIGGEGAR